MRNSDFKMRGYKVTKFNAYKKIRNMIMRIDRV